MAGNAGVVLGDGVYLLGKFRRGRDGSRRRERISPKIAMLK
jgi:hypothetical protein